MPTLQEITDTLYRYADEFSIEKFPARHREHLGISIIGDPCARKIWYAFRWVKLIEHIPRMRRLFDRGQREEAIFEGFLLWAGFRLRSINPETGKQFKISLLDGHYGGSTDGMALISWADGMKVILEYKTHNAKSFAYLKQHKLKKAKPQHFDQMCGYGKDFKVVHGVYCAVNKDDDDWYFETIELDWNRATELENKARDIIQAKLPPQRIAENPSYFNCKYCDYLGICHNGEPVEKNCRSCKLASPVEKGEWFCERYKNIIPQDFIAKGCDGHTSVNE